MYDAFSSSDVCAQIVSLIRLCVESIDCDQVVGASHPLLPADAHVVLSGIGRKKYIGIALVRAQLFSIHSHVNGGSVDPSSIPPVPVLDDVDLCFVRFRWRKRMLSGFRLHIKFHVE